jgi:8-oxo-dGTP diphosphatase
VREVREETGVTIRLGVPLDTIRYEAGKAGLKKVDYWGGTVLEVVRRAPDAEVDVVSWLPVRAALARLTYSHDHFLVQQYLEQPATTPVIIVRHAKAMDRKDWSRKDPARPLNTRAGGRPGLLVPMLEAYGITRLVSSTATRLSQHAAAVRAPARVSIESYSQLTEEEGSNDAKGVAKLVARIRTAALADNQPTAICVHRPVLPHVLDALRSLRPPGHRRVPGRPPDAEGEVHALSDTALRLSVLQPGGSVLRSATVVA